ncbi:MAG TPA: hypothetical protein VI306_07830 [Pyrinomonadaceae bacterium]
MQQDQDSSNTSQETKHQDRVRQFLSRREIHGIAIAVWVFVAGFVVVRLYIYDHISEPAKASEVLIASTFSLAIVIVVVIHAVMYYKQAKEANRQADIAQRSLQVAREALARGNRPSVGLLAVTVEPIEVGKQIHVDITWRNSGSSIAHHCKSLIRIELLWQDKPVPNFGYQGMVSRGALGINAISITPVFSEFDLNEAAWNAIQMGGMKGILRVGGQWLFLYARITYDDGAGRDFFTEFCGRYNPRLKGFETCDVFNEAS